MLRRLLSSRKAPARRRLVMEQLEAREVPAALVAASYFDGALYQFDSDTGALQETLVAPGSSSLLAGISGVAAGPDGNLYISSQTSPFGSPANSIVRFNYANRTLSTFIPSGVLQQVAAANGEANFAPAGLGFGPDGNLYVVMNGGRGIAGNDGVVRFKIDSTSNGLLYGNQATVVGSGSLFSEPTMLAFGPGGSSDLYVSSGLTKTVVKITDATGAAPTASEFIAAGAGGLVYPSGLTWGPNGDLFVTDLADTGASQGQILAFNADGTFDSVFAGGSSFGTPGSLQFQFPSAAVFDTGGNLYTANLGPAYPPNQQGSIFKYDSTGSFTNALVTPASFPASPASTGGSPSQLVFFGSPPVVPPPPPPTPTSTQIAISGQTNGATNIIKPDANGIYSSTPVAFVNPFANLNVVVHTAMGDVDGDQVDDYIVATGAGTPTLVAVMNGADPFVYLVAPFSPFEGSESFSGGAFVAAGDLDGDGFAEFVVAPDQGGGPRVTIWNMTPAGFSLRKNFLAFSDPNFRGGARVAIGDVNNDGTVDLGVAAGFEGGPRVTIYDGDELFGSQTQPGTAQEPVQLANFYAFAGPDVERLRNGVFLALGDINGDGFADLIAGAGPGGAPRVSIISGSLLMSSGQAAVDTPLADFFVAGNTSDRGGVRVAAKQADGDSLADLIVGSGEGSPARVRTYLGSKFTTAAEPAAEQDFDPFGVVFVPRGVFVG